MSDVFFIHLNKADVQSGCGYIAAIASVDDIECYAVVFVSI